MTDEQLEIARALVTHPQWRWRSDGECADCRGRGKVESESRGPTGPISYVHPCATCGGTGHALPDLIDDATGGVLLGLLWTWCREQSGGDTRYKVQAWGLAHGWEIAVVRVVERGRYTEEDSPVAEEGQTLAEAAARALLACWGER